MRSVAVRNALAVSISEAPYCTSSGTDDEEVNRPADDVVEEPFWMARKTLMRRTKYVFR